MHNVIHRIAVPNPFFEGRNSVYLLKCDPVTLIDTGVATDKAYDYLVTSLKSHGVSISDVERVILTHKHIDHIGNAWRIQRESGAEVLIHEVERNSLEDVDPTGKRFAGMVQGRLSAWKVPQAMLADSDGSKMPPWNLESCEPTSIMDGDLLETELGSIEVLHTPGHTMGSICLKSANLLFSGDHVLETISPNVGGGDMRSRGMLARFLNSLDRIGRLGEDDVEVFPGHGEPFRSVSARCTELAQHHQQRLDETLAAASEAECSVYQVATTLFGELSDFHIVLGCAEANAHLEFLVDKGAVTESDGLYRKT